MMDRSTSRIGLVAAVCLALGASLGVPADALTYGTISDVTAAGARTVEPQVAVSHDGTKATAVWLRDEGGDLVVQTRSAIISAGVAQWGPPATLSQAGHGAENPQVVVSADGASATAVWSRFNGTSWVVQARSGIVIGNNSQWGATADLSANVDPGDDARNPQIDLSADGEIAVAVWQRGLVDGQRIESAKGVISGALAMWQGDLDVTAAGQDAVTPQIEISDDGVRGTVVWARRTGGAASPYQVQSKSGGSAGAGWIWNGGHLGLSDPLHNASRPTLGLADDGNAATVVWLWDNGSNDVVQTNSLLIEGPISYSSATRTLSAIGRDAVDPDVAVSADGARAAAIWSRANAPSRTLQSIHASVADGVATWGAPVTVASGSIFAPHLSLSETGTTASAVWMSLSDDGNLVESATGQVAGTTGSWDARQLLSAPAGDANTPTFDVSTDGRKATAVWVDVVGNNDSAIRSASALVSQTITFPPLAARRVDRGPVALRARASSGLPVTYLSLTPAVCRTQAANVILRTVGACEIRATQSGDGTYAAASPVRRSFRVTAVPEQTELSVRARKKKRKLTLRKKAAVVRSVTTDGVITDSTATCLHAGVVARKACTIKRPAGRIVITPKCTTKVKARVRITAQAQGAEAATFTRTWRVKPKPRKAC